MYNNLEHSTTRFSTIKLLHSKSILSKEIVFFFKHLEYVGFWIISQFKNAINLNSLQQSNRLKQTLWRSWSWLALLQDPTFWFLHQNLLFGSDLIPWQLFSSTTQSHIQTKLTKLEIEFRASIFQRSWILYFWVRQLSCKHLQKSDRGSQSFPFFQEPKKIVRIIRIKHISFGPSMIQQL